MFDEIRIVRASVCVRAWNARDGSCGIMRVCATWPSDSPGPRKRLEDLRPHDGVEWESGRSLVQASWDFAVRVIYVWMREQWCNIWWDEMGWDCNLNTLDPFRLYIGLGVCCLIVSLRWHVKCHFWLVSELSWTLNVGNVGRKWSDLRRIVF